MAKQRFALEYGDKKRLTLSWKGWYRELKVAYDENEVASFLNQDDLIQGQSVILPDGSNLEVKLNKSWLTTNLKLLRNGKPLPGTNSDIYRKLSFSYIAMYFIAAMSILNGLASIFLSESYNLLSILATIGVGIVFIILGIFTKKLSMTAVIIALIIYGIDTVLVFINGKTTGIFSHIVFMYAIYQGIPTIKAIRETTEKEKVTSPQS
jgi:hypothetical protein